MILLEESFHFEMLILFICSPFPFFFFFFVVPPKIYDISPDITVNEGSNVSLICTASGKPEPTITWRHITPLGEFTSPLTYPMLMNEGMDKWIEG